MQIPFFNLQRQYQGLRKNIQKEIKSIFERGAFILGDKVNDFEKKFSRYCSVNHCLGVNNGTSALYLALLSLGIRRRDEVITQPNTFIATAEAIAFTGAKPVFVDINPQTYNLDVNKLEKAITKKTKAIIAVHLFGEVSDMEPILKLTAKHHLFLIEDASQAQGAEYKGKKAGSLADIGCFSFYPTKVLGAAGEAGAVVTNSEKLASIMKKIRDHGSENKYYHTQVGFNFRMEEIQGAVLAVKLKYLDQWIKSRRKKAEIYNFLLQGCPVTLPFEPAFCQNAYYVYVIRAESRDKLQEYLAKNGIETMIHYPLPIHLQPAFKFLGYKKGDFPESERAAKEVLSLPFFPEIKFSEQKYVAQKIKEFYLKK